VPELPEVEILVRHLQPLLKGKTIRAVRVHRPKIIAPHDELTLKHHLLGARFKNVFRRGKFLVFQLARVRTGADLTVIGHLGMTGRMYLLKPGQLLPRHTALDLDLGKHRFVFEDTRYFGRFTLDADCIAHLGPEPLSRHFTPDSFRVGLQRSSQPIKTKLLDQTLVAGIGNIYASEALFRAGLSPRLAARRLTEPEIVRLWRAIRDVLEHAIRSGSTLRLNLSGPANGDRLFYFGTAGAQPVYHHERLLVYDRAGKPCVECGAAIRRLVQSARSTFYCPQCQRRAGNAVFSSKTRAKRIDGPRAHL
jgi:formamidopyrimidine-DNA glycosylase